MPTTFISNSSGDIPSGTILLWYGAKAAIPLGWSYYAEAAGYWVKGAISANTTPQNTADHSHTYSADTGSDGDHTHTPAALSISVGAIVTNQVVTCYSAAEPNILWATSTHTHPTLSLTVSDDTGHQHDVLTTETQEIFPPSVGIYYIEKVG